MTVGELVERERVSLRRGYLAVATAVVVALTCGLLAISSAMLGGARWMELPRGLPSLVWALIVAGDVGVAWVTMRWLGQRTSRDDVATSIEREQSLRSGALRGVLEVGESGVLGRHASVQMSARLERAGPHLVPAARRSLTRRAWHVGAAAAFAATLLGAAAPTYSDGLRAILRPDRAWRGTLLPPIAFDGLPSVVMRGEPLRLRVRAPGRRSVALVHREEGEGWQSEALAVAPGTGIATTVVGPLRGDVHLVISDGRSSTDTMLVRVTDRPFVGDVAMRATYPAYLGRPSEELPIGEPARVPYGTIIGLSGHASAILRAVTLANGHDSLGFGVTAHAFSGQFEAKRSGTWEWLAKGPDGAITDVPLPLELEVIPDSVPNVVITSPSVDTMVASTDRLTLLIGASDDHGLVNIELRSWPVSAGAGDQSAQPNRPVLVQQLATLHGTVWNGSAAIDLAPRGLQPGDALHVQAVATDNSPWAQHGESRQLLLRIPTADERREAARAMGDSAVAAAQSVVEAERAIQQRTDQMARDRGTRDPAADAKAAMTLSVSPSGVVSSTSPTSGDMSYEGAEKARALAKDQRTLTDQVKQLQEGAKALEDQLRQAGALDSSLARQLQEAQALLKDALTPELLAQMQKLDNAAQQLSRDDAQTTLKDLQAMQAKLREQLEKSAELLKRAAIEGSMQTLGDEAQELANRDKQLADSLHGSAQPQTKRPDAQQLADQTDHVSSAMQKLQDRLAQDQATAGASHAADAQQHAAASEEQLSGAAAPAAGASMEAHTRDAAAQMQQSAEAMQQARDAQIQSWKRELTSALDQSIQEMLQMSREEAALEQQVQSGQSKPEDVRGEQSAIKQGLDDAAKRLQQEGQKTSLLSSRSQTSVNDAEHSMQQAVQSSSATTPRPGETASAMADAAGALNRAAASLARDRARANTATSATGFAEMMQELQAMANKQGAINSQAQSLLSMPGGQMTAAMQGTARELARQQRQLAQQLEELGDGPGGERAAQLALQAKQVADALDNGQLNAETLARQQQLFHKMLDAGRTLEQDEREDGDHREAKSATSSEQFVPTNTNATGKAASRFPEPTWDELRGLSADERRAILDYFQKINGHGG